jgi:hypothetical protein
MKRSAQRHSGISKRTIVHRSRIGGRDSTVISSGKQNEREAAAQERRREAIKGKPSFQPRFKIFTGNFIDLWDADRQAVAQMDIAMHGTSDDVDSVANTAALGEEGVEMSHEGGEFEVFENLARDIASSTG